MEENKEQRIFTSCPNCNGSGFLRTMDCRNCQGSGLGVFERGSWYFFKAEINALSINLHKFKDRLDLIIDIITYVIICFGLGALIWWLFAYGQVVQAFSLMESHLLRGLIFWETQHWLLWSFWVAILFVCFVIYRFSRRKEKMHIIKPSTYQENLNQAPMISDWEEVKKLSKKNKTNVFAGANEKVISILEKAFTLAESLQHPQINSLHLFAATLMVSSEAAALFSRLNVSEQTMVQKIQKKLGETPPGPLKTSFGAEARKIMITAYLNAADKRQDQIRELDILLPAFDLNPFISELLYELETERDKLANGIAWFKISDMLQDRHRQYRRVAQYKPSSNMDRAYTAVATPLLDNFSHDITLAAKWGRVDICLGRDEEIREVFDRLESGRLGIVLVGGEGTGKTTIVGGIAQLMVLEDVPAILNDKRLLELDLSRLIGGSTPAEAEAKLLQIISEINRAGNIILYIKNIERISGIGSGGEESLNLAGVLADALDRHALICFASSTEENYSKYIEHSALGNSLSAINVKEPSPNAAIVMIESKVGWYEHKYNVYFSYDSLAEVINLTDRYIHDAYLPKKALEVLEQVAVKASRRQDKTVDKEAIAEVITELTHIPVTKLTDDESKGLLGLEEKIHERMIGQDEAVKMVAAALRRARVELRESKRPIANFLFLGPTGVGKTELAKTVSEVYFGREDYMIRLDMSEYQEQRSLSKMIGSPDGAIGYLTEAVRKMPFTLILLDEIEKAHPDILNLFLQVMDDGRLTDGQGRTADFTNSIIIATSNIGSNFIQQEVRKNTPLAEIKEKLVREELSQAMRPELINRFDGVIVFTPLDNQAVISIAKLMLKKIATMLEAKGFGFNISEEAIAKLAELGFEPEYGARPLRRLLQERVEDAIATKILSGEVGRRDTIIINDDLEITVAKAERL